MVVCPSLEARNQGHNIIFNSQAKFRHEGLYWLELYSDEKLLAKSPFRLTYTRSSAQRGPTT